MLEMAAVFARLEREMIRERVVAGLRRAVASGKTLGRPTLGNERDKARARDGARQIAAILTARKQGKGKVKIAKELGVGVGTVSRVLAEPKLTRLR
jgi:DNA invertase Pin-like site-specific DNA recombinase